MTTGPGVCIQRAVFTPAADPWLQRAELVFDALRAAPGRLFTGLDEGRLAALLAGGLALSTLWPVARPELPSRVVHLPGAGWVNAATVEGLDASVPDGTRLVLRAEDAAACQVASGEPATAPPPGVDGVGSPGVAFGRPVSINHASVAELESLPGIGPALAARVVAGRPYASVDDLDRVKGIGPKTLARLRPRVGL